MKRNTKKTALVMSFVSLLICVTMLVGSTFAWFTDTATASVNTIQAGNLHVEIQDTNNQKIEALEWVTADNREQNEILWEPGCTYTLTPFKIANTGNLALKYKLVVTGVEGDAELLKVIKFTYKLGDADLNLDEERHLKKDEKTGLITISAHMDEAAGNDYMDKTLEGVKITVYATQDTVENDSYGPNYDETATYYPVIDAAGLKDALAKGGKIKVTEDTETNNPENTEAARTVISQPTTLDLEKKIISPDNMGRNNINFAALYVDADTTINAGADGGIDTGKNGGYGINVRNGAKLTINGGYYYGGGTAVQVQKGTLIINGGTFACEPYDDPKYGYKFLINCIDAAYKDGTAKIEIYGGTFINFDPADSASENPHGNFVADGYTVISETKANGDVWYTVVKVEGTVVNNEADLATALTNAAAGSKIILNCDITSLSLADDVTIADGIIIDGQGKFSISRDAWMALSNLSITIQNAQMG